MKNRTVIVIFAFLASLLSLNAHAAVAGLPLSEAFGKENVEKATATVDDILSQNKESTVLKLWNSQKATLESEGFQADSGINPGIRPLVANPVKDPKPLTYKDKSYVLDLIDLAHLYYAKQELSYLGSQGVLALRQTYSRSLGRGDFESVTFNVKVRYQYNDSGDAVRYTLESVSSTVELFNINEGIGSSAGITR